MLVELKNGETYNGTLASCDTWMNVHLKEVICTSKDGDRFWRMAECYVRGNTIKYVCVPDEVLDVVKEEMKNRPQGGGAKARRRAGRARRARDDANARDDGARARVGTREARTRERRRADASRRR